MRKLSELWRRLWRKVLLLLGISGTALLFTAGYGQRQPVDFIVTVKSSATGEPVSGVKVAIRQGNSDANENTELMQTDNDGMFYYTLPWTYHDLIYIIELEDETEDGERFQRKRVIHRMEDGRSIEITLDEK